MAKYAIIAHPNSGIFTPDRKYRILKPLAEILADCDRDIYGLDTVDLNEFRQCAKDLEDKVSVLVVAGGDGAFYEVINSVNLELSLGYLPLGTCNTLRHALNLPRSPEKITYMIKEGKIHKLDLLSCNGYKGFNAAIGIEGYVLEEREKLKQSGINGFKSYAIATAKELMKLLKTANATVEVNNNKLVFNEIATIIIGNHKYYGGSLKVNPKAVIDDGILNMIIIAQDKLEIFYALLTSLIIGNKAGANIECTEAHISLNQIFPLQIDGVVACKGREFEVKVLPKALKMVY